MSVIALQIDAVTVIYFCPDRYSIQQWTGYEGNSAQCVPEGVQVDNYIPRPYIYFCTIALITSPYLYNIDLFKDTFGCCQYFSIQMQLLLRFLFQIDAVTVEELVSEKLYLVMKNLTDIEKADLTVSGTFSCLRYHKKKTITGNSSEYEDSECSQLTQSTTEGERHIIN